MSHVITINIQHLYTLPENSTNRTAIKEKIIIFQAQKLKEYKAVTVKADKGSTLALTDEESYNETKEGFISSNVFASLDKDPTNTFQNNKKVFELQQRPYPQQINMAIHYLKSKSYFS